MAWLQHIYLMNLTTCTISIHITHAIEICSVCCWLRQLSTRAPPGSAEPRSGTHFLWPCSLLASSPISASETSLARTCERAAKPRGAEERRASLQRSLIKFHLYFAQTKGNTIGWKMTLQKSKLIDNRPSWHPLRLCDKFGFQGHQIGTENLFQPSKQMGSFDVILTKRILRAEDKSDWVCSSIVFVCVKHLV